MRKARKARWLSLMLTAVMVLGMMPSPGVAADEFANSVEVTLSVAPTAAYRNESVSYTVTVENKDIAGAVPATVTVSIQLPGPTGTASGVVVPLATDVVLGVGDSITYTAASVPALEFSLSGINPGVAIARARVDYYAIYDTSPVFDAEGSKNIPVLVLDYAELGDYVWHDVDRDGIQDGDELGIPGVTVNLRDCASGDLLDTTVTDGSGLYLFDGLMAGDYKVEFVSPAGYVFTTQDADGQGVSGALNSDADAAGMTACVSLAPGDSKLFVDAGLWMPVEELVVTKTAKTSYVRTHKWLIDKWVETDYGKTEEFDEGILPKIWLYADGSGDESGYWYVQVDHDGYVDSDFNVSGTVTIENTGDLDAEITSVTDLMGVVAADVDFAAGIPFTLKAGETTTGVYSQDVDSNIEGPNVATVVTARQNTYTGSADIVWGDPDEEYLTEVTVEDVSDWFGTKTLGTVTVAEGTKTFTYSNAFAWTDFDSAGPHFIRNTATILETKQSASAVLAINWVPGYCIGGYKWERTEGTPGMGWTIQLWKANEAGEYVFLAETATGADGKYCFDGLMAGDYKVTEVLKDGWVQLAPADPNYHLVTLPDGASDCEAVPMVNPYNFLNDMQVQRYDETAWAYGGPGVAKANNTVPNNPKDAWGWTNKITGPGTYVWDLYAGAGQNDISKGMLVGTVTVVYDGTNATVTYAVDADYEIDEAHLWVGNTMLPMVGKKLATASPGQFPYSPVISADKSTATYTVAVSAPFWVAAHAVVAWYE